MQLTENFELAEFTVSQTAARRGIPNNPPQHAIENLRQLSRNILQPIRNHFGVVSISSGYRSVRLNHLVGGKWNSQHIKGEATDFIVPGKDLEEVFNWIKDSDLDFDQLILEYGSWIHISYTTSRKNRRQVINIR